MLDFLKKYHPKDHDNFRIIALAFGMYREMAEHHESVGLQSIDAVKHEILSNKSFFCIVHLCCTSHPRNGFLLSLRSVGVLCCFAPF